MEAAKGMLPLYYRVASSLRARIESGEYEENSFLSTEQDLGKEYGVSRITIRQALTLLRREGLIYSRSGYGTVVRPARNGRRPYAKVVGSLRELSVFGQSTEFKPISRKVVPATKFIAEKLQCEEGAELIGYTGIRLMPDLGEIAYTEAYVPYQLGEGISLEMIKVHPLFILLNDIHGLQITDAEQVMSAVAADKRVAKTLGVKRGTPLLKVTRTYSIEDGKPVEVAFSWYDTSRFEPVVHLGQET